MQTQINATYDDATITSLLDLHRRTMDVLAGYETMLDKAEAEFRPTVQRYIALHRAHAGKLASILIAAGQQPDENGSFMGTINKAVVSVRAMFDEIDSDVLKQIHSGEQNVLKAFDDVLASGRDNATDLTDIATMRAELTRLLDATRPPGGIS